MTTRKIAAETTGPVTIDATLKGHGGVISVRVDDKCERATLTISTTDDDGPAAEAVRAATLRQSVTGLYASVVGKGGTNTGTTTIITGGRGGMTIIQNAGTVHGEMVGMNFADGDVTVNGVRVSGGGTVIAATAPVEIVATVPPGSKVIGNTQSADVEALGTFAAVSAFTQSGAVRVDTSNKVTASTQSGGVTVDKADEINVKTMSGGVYLNVTDVVEAKTMSGAITIQDFAGTARLKTMSGAIRVHATGGGDLDAKTMSGAIDVTATEAALADNLDVRPRSMSGRISVPSRRTPGASPRRRR
ncbi:DUF4097 family beta strand repeat-containing protein [Streptomyces sp. NPDC021969]|uniref:DUF4097 family beta strand repeat-containing protein n=1 Tax=unclassified Streptomyces TaxID=2593676 RepID=UPI0033E14F33